MNVENSGSPLERCRILVPFGIAYFEYYLSDFLEYKIERQGRFFKFLVVGIAMDL